MASFSQNEPDQLLYLKMQAIDNLKSSTVLQVADQSITKELLPQSPL